MKSTPCRPGPLQRTTRIALAVLLVLSHPLWAATIIVDEATCTLVDAIDAANTDTATGGCPAGSGADTIELTTDVTLTRPNNYDYGSDNGLPVVESEITVEGGGLTIERDVDAPAFRLFQVAIEGNLTLNHATLRNGDEAINSLGTTTLTHCTVSDNLGLGLSLGNGGIHTLTNSTVSGNGSGGIRVSDATLYLMNSTVSDNAFLGVGGRSYARTHLTNTTVSGNGSGGVDLDWSWGTLTNTTVSGNSGAGIRADYFGYAEVDNSIVAGNVGGNCVTFEINSYISPGGMGNNFDDDGTCWGFGDITPGVDFDTNLADNSGPTQTHALFPGSVAIDAAGYCGLPTDQRGEPRRQGECDSGSYEVQCSIAVTTDGVDTLIWFTPDSTEFNIVAGYLSDLLAGGNYSRATCLGTYTANPAVDTLPEPPVGDGTYYLARGLTSCMLAQYGDSSLNPDPRDALAAGPCP